MKIDYTKLNKKSWFEDENGNEIEIDEVSCATDVINSKYLNGEVVLYERCFPLELHEYTYEYCYHPKNLVVKFLCRRIPGFYRWISKGKYRTFRNVLDCRTTWSGGQDCILSMVNSGDFTLEQAIWVYANSCERCMNVLAHKYLGEDEGYEEYSEEWEKCGTVCDFCRASETSETKNI